VTRNKWLIIGSVGSVLASLVIVSSLPVSATPYAPQTIYLPLILKPGSSAPTVSILPNHFSYTDSINYLHILGEIQNSTTNTLRFVKVTADLFNASDQIVWNDYTYVWLDNLPPNSKTCFDVSLSQPTTWSYYQFEKPTYSTDGSLPPNLAVVNPSGSYDSLMGWYTLIGLIRNDSNTRVDYVQAVGTLYNATGKVIGCDFTYVNSTNLDAGQISSFKMTFTGRNYTDVSSYRLQVDGTPK
jgi:hypothetical protein